MENKFSKYLVEGQVKNGSKFRVIIMDLSKAFQSLNHDSLLPKLEAVTFMRSHLTSRLQRCKIKNSFSEWTKISAWVPKWSILVPLFSNIFINNIFLFLQKCGLPNYADDSITHTSDKRVFTIIDSLRHEFTILPKWFYSNLMVLDPEEFSFMLLHVEDSC